HRMRMAAVAAVLAASSAAGLSPSMAAASAGRSEARPAAVVSAGARAARAGGAVRPLLLITGDRVWTGSVGGNVRGTGVRPAAGGFSYQFLFLNCAGQIEVPTDALLYLGRGLDPSLFDLAKLRRAEAGGKLPVRVGYRGHVPALPGVTLTRSGNGTAY